MTIADGHFELLETMAFDPMEGLILLDLHIARVCRSAEMLGFACDRHVLRNELQAATFRLTDRRRVRVLLSRKGNIAVEIRPYRSWPDAVMRTAVVPCPIAADDLRLAHKTTDRQFYRDVLAKGGTFEVLMTDREGFLTEGCFSNIFVERDDKLLTPPLARGLLPGVLRQSLIDLGEAEEADLKPRDLERGFFIGNAARGLVAAALA